MFPTVFHVDRRIALNGSRGSYPGYMDDPDGRLSDTAGQGYPSSG